MGRVRIIAGEFGRRRIETPDSGLTHPMGERVRGALFNSLGDISGLKVLDAFAGSGAVGMEALSRGAKSAEFVENDRRAVRILHKNIETLQIHERTRVRAMGVGKFLGMSDELFDLVFADPPYNFIKWGLVERLWEKIREGGRLVVSHGKDNDELRLPADRKIFEGVYAEAKIEIFEK